jgi:hypothetical protein
MDQLAGFAGQATLWILDSCRVRTRASIPRAWSLEDFVEHRHDLEEILLSGLPDDERQHVVEIINKDDESKLHELRARSDWDDGALEVT